MATLMDYSNCVSAEDYSITSFTSTELEKDIVKQIKRPLERLRKHPLELSEVQANKENIQVAPDPRNSKRTGPTELFHCSLA